MKKTIYVAWYGKTHNVHSEKFPVYGIGKQDKVFADRTFDSRDDALNWVVDQLRPMCSVGRDGRTIRGIVYAREANRRALIVGQAQFYVIDDRKAHNTKVFAAGGARAKKI